MTLFKCRSRIVKSTSVSQAVSRPFHPSGHFHRSALGLYTVLAVLAHGLQTLFTDRIWVIWDGHRGVSRAHHVRGEVGIDGVPHET